MASAGRPTEYQPDYCALAYNYCLLGATNEELAGFFDVTRRTVDNWIAAHPEFAAAVRAGRALADAKVARGLYDRAVGYDRNQKRTTEHGGETTTVTTEMHYPANPQACIFWLRNRRRRTWHEKAEPAAADGEADIVTVLDAAGESMRHVRGD